MPADVPGVIMILPYMEAGGTERHALHLVRGLLRDYRVGLLSPDGPMLDRFLELGVAHRAFPRLGQDPLGGLRAVRRGLRALLDRVPAGVIHVHAAPELAVLTRTVHRSIPVVLTTHGFAVANPAANYRLAARLCRLGRVNRVISVSRWEADMLGRGGLAPGRVRVVHNGIPDPQQPAVDWRAQLGWPAGAPVVGAVGRLEPVKGFHLLLEALAELQEPPGPAWSLPPRLVVVGDGSQRAELERRAGAPDLAGRVHFAGYREDAWRAPGGFDVLVMPSLQEAFPLACLEAMAAGRPVIASRVGGLPEMVEDGRTGLLVPPGDARAVAEALRRMLPDPAAARRMGAAARARFLDQFHVDRMVEQTALIYRDLGA